MEIKAKFWIENKGEVVAGGGKIALISAVGRLGSIQRAADEFRMSYRHAWGVIKRLNNGLVSRLWIRRWVGKKKTEPN